MDKKKFAPKTEQSNVTTTHQVQFNNYLVEFIKKLREVLPEKFKRSLTKYYKYYRKYSDGGKRIEFIQEFINYVGKYNEEISKCDEGLFSEEPEYYPNQPIQLLKSIDFKKVWKSELTEKTKESIWKYLQTLYVIGTYVLKQADRMNKLLKKQQQLIHNIIQSLKLEQKIKDDANKLNEEEAAESAGGFDLSNLGDIFGEDNLITQLAVEVAKELDIPEEQLSNPMEAIQLLFGQNGSKLQEIMAKVGSKLKEKMEQEGVTEEQVFAEAKKMNDSLVNKFKGIPGMPDIEKFSKEMADNIAQEMNTHGGENGEMKMPSIDELTRSLNDNLEQLGIDNLNEFQKNFNEIMTELQNTTEDPSNEQKMPDHESDELPPVESIMLDNNNQLQDELDRIKKSIEK